MAKKKAKIKSVPRTRRPVTVEKQPVAPLSERIVPQDLISHYGLLTILVLVLLLPYAIPAIYDAFALRMSWTRFYYLDSPVANQWYLLSFGIVILLLPYILARVIWPPTVWHRNLLTFVGFGFGLAQLVSCLQAPNPLFACKTAVPMFMSILFFLAIGTFGLKKSDVVKIPLIAILSMLPISLYALAQSRGWDFLPYVPWGTNEGDTAIGATEGKQAIAATFGHPNYMGAYMAPLMFWCIYYSFTARFGKILRSICTFIAVLMLVTMIVGGTRGPLVGLFVGLLCYYINLTFVPRFRRLLLFCAGVAIFIGILVLFVPNPFVQVNFPLAERFFGSKEIASRFYYWFIAIDMFKAHPLFGVGAGGYNLYFWDYMNAFQLSSEGPKYAFVVSDVLIGKNPGFVHNDYLQFLCEGGAVTLVFFLWLWTTILSQCWRTCSYALKCLNENAAIISATFFASFITIATDCIFNFQFHIPVSLLWFWIMAALWIVYRESVMSELTPPETQEENQ